MSQTAHSVLPTNHLDEAARQDFVLALRRHMTGSITPGNASVYAKRVKPQLEASLGHAPRDRWQVAAGMIADPYYQFWSALQRCSQQLMWDSVADSVDQQLAPLAAAAQAAPHPERLRLNPNLPIPEYVSAADIHLMPGGYHQSLFDGDVSQGALYDRGLYLYIGGQCGPRNDGLGRLLADGVARDFPHLKPKRILDMGCTIGNCTLVWKDRYPDAEVIGIDVSAPTLRYAHARAEALGVEAQFVQTNAEATEFAPGSFDLITSCLFFHETSAVALPRILAECKRLLRSGGVMAHLDVPQVGSIDPLQAFLTSWEEANNNENFATLYRDMDLTALVGAAGFDPARISCPGLPMVGGVDVRNYDTSGQLRWTYVTAQA
jgi:SAM-dependent methyltransferase